MTISIINLKYFFLFLYFDLIIQNENLIGKKLFIENCNVCHLNKENKIIPEKTLKKNILETNGLNNFDSIVYQIVNGKNGMPAFGSKLNSNEINKIVEYLLTEE